MFWKYADPGLCVVLGVERLASGARHERREPAPRTGVPVWIHGFEPLIVVVVPGQRDVDVLVVGDLPEAQHELVGVVPARGVPRIVHRDRGALAWVVFQVGLQPLLLSVAVNVAAVGVEHVDPPLPRVPRIPGLALVYVREVAVGVLGAGIGGCPAGAG